MFIEASHHSILSDQLENWIDKDDYKEKFSPLELLHILAMICPKYVQSLMILLFNVGEKNYEFLRGYSTIDVIETFIMVAVSGIRPIMGLKRPKVESMV